MSTNTAIITIIVEKIVNDKTYRIVRKMSEIELAAKISIADHHIKEGLDEIDKAISQDNKKP